ncbi:IS200/IS605 family accessory protein TnpB-related protein [Streptomyces azureus]|uniref:IS200/IS605 family accessory protein TnpB-related protein n=1 Tax=Streptomyces azureus TaxID=146537 RepID=UPI003C2BB189
MRDARGLGDLVVRARGSLEDLTGVRERVRLRKSRRATHSSWSFHQLGQFIAYRARKVGVPVVHVDPAYTSVPAPSAATSAQRTGSPRSGSRAGPAASLRTRTGTAPATSAPVRGSCGDAGCGQPPQPHP